MNSSKKSNNSNCCGFRSLFIGLTLLALVISIGLAFVPKLITKMTSACAHNPASHLRLRPDRDVLPTNAVPIKYDLTIKPDMDNFTFEGKVLIEYATKSLISPH